MGIWARAWNAVTGRGAQTPLPNPTWSMLGLPFRWVPADFRLTADEATSVSVVWACIQAIVTPIASSPWEVFEVSGRRRKFLPDDRLAYVLNQRATDDVTAIAFREALLFGALAHGSGYAEIVRDSANRVVGLKPLDPLCVLPKRLEDGTLVYEYTGPGGTVVLNQGDVFHLRGPVSVEGLMGDSLVARASKAIALAAAAERFSLQYLANGAIPTGAFEHPGKLDDRSYARIKQQLEEKTTGVRNAGKPLLLEGGLKYAAIQSEPDRAQLGQTQVWSVENIARYFGVPLVKLGVQAAAQGYGTNVETLNLEWSRTGLRPWALRLEQEANAKLLSPMPYRETVIDMGWLVRGDAKTQAEADKLRLESGVLSVNEIREELGLNTIGKEGDIRFVSSGLAPLTTTLLELQEMQAEPPEPPPAPGQDAAAADQVDAEDGAEDPAEGDTEDAAPPPVVRQALRGMVVQNLKHLETEIERKRASAKRRGGEPADVSGRLEAATAELREKLAKDFYPAIALIRQVAAEHGRHVNGEADAAALAAIDAVASGKAPEAEADRLLSELLPEGPK